MRRMIVLALVVLSYSLQAQKVSDMELMRIARWGDSLVFDRGFNHCDMEALGTVISTDFEFYHDQGGITKGKENFIESMRKGICMLNYKAIRKHVPGTMKVFPLFDQGKLYGLIVHGDHEFWAIEKDKPEHRTSIAKYTSLWLIENGEWKFRRALSYDHHAAN